jgi:hypothetical protein
VWRGISTPDQVIKLWHKLLNRQKSTLDQGGRRIAIVSAIGTRERSGGGVDGVVAAETAAHGFVTVGSGVRDIAEANQHNSCRTKTIFRITGAY